MYPDPNPRVCGARRAFACLAVICLLYGCVRMVPPGEGPAPAPANALLAGVRPGPSIVSLALTPADAGAALASFVESCPRLLIRTDASGLTRSEDWRSACSAASAWPQGDAARFFAGYFETAVVGTGESFATGYFEPEIAGSRTRRPGFDVPVYRMPDDLVRAWPADTPEVERTGRPPLGRYDESGAFVPYYDRAEIENGALV